MDEQILVIEDDEEIRYLLKRALSFEGYKVDLAEDGVSGLKMAKAHHPALIVLDLMLPGMDGYEVSKKLREITTKPILMLTARDQLNDKIKGFDSGADDYLVKPFDVEELSVRIKALLRRTAGDRNENLELADLVLDHKTRQAIRGKRIITLTATEYELLHLFMSHPGEVVTREMIFNQIWDYGFSGESNVLDVYIRYLRQKLEQDGEPRLLFTMRGVGYLMREP